ncbi:MAG TPA: hypothetical protein VK348_13195, partial [Planctomycetota bacterium]|nr:hypothetical protein [Planctomycetota bacterium]
KDQAGKVGAPDPAAKAKAAPAAPRGARPGEPDALGRLHNPGAAKADDSSRVAIQPAVPAVVLARRAQIPAAGGPPSPAQQPPSSPTVFFGLLAQQQDAAGVAGKGVAVPTIRQWSLPVAAPDTNLFLQHEVHFGNRTEVAGQEAQATGLLALREDVRRLLGDDGQGTSVFLVEGDRTQVTALLQQVRAFAAPEQWDLRVDEVAATAVAELEQLPLPQGQVLLQQQTRPLATVLQDQVQQPPSAANDRRKSEVPVAGAAADDKADDKAKVPPPAAQQQPAERVRVMLLYRDVAVPLPAEQKAREPRKD